MDDIHAADAILVSTHSQASIVSTHLLDRLISEEHIRTARNGVVLGPAGSFLSASGANTAPAPRFQKLCCLAMCGIHLGPLRSLSTTTLLRPYLSAPSSFLCLKRELISTVITGFFALQVRLSQDDLMNHYSVYGCQALFIAPCSHYKCTSLSKPINMPLLSSVERISRVRPTDLDAKVDADADADIEVPSGAADNPGALQSHMS